MDLRRSVVLSIGLGLATASIGSLVFAGQPQARAIASLDARLTAISGRRPEAVAPPVSSALQFASLFPVFNGASAAPEVPVALTGIARSPLRTAALISINAGPAEWLAVGESREGVIVQDVTASSVTIDTPRGVREVRLGEGAAPAPPMGAEASEAPPPGFRMPPEPASAPGAPK